MTISFEIPEEDPRESSGLPEPTRIGLPRSRFSSNCIARSRLPTIRYHRPLVSAAMKSMAS